MKNLSDENKRMIFDITNKVIYRDVTEKMADGMDLLSVVLPDIEDKATAMLCLASSLTAMALKGMKDIMGDKFSLLDAALFSVALIEHKDQTYEHAVAIALRRSQIIQEAETES